jgi:hypothetical protein
VLALAGLAAPDVLAKSFCVAPATGCDVNTSATIAGALSLANNDAVSTGGPEIVKLGAATYNETGLVWTSYAPLTLQGAGVGRSVVAPTDGSVTRIFYGFSSTAPAPVTVTDMSFTVPSNSNGVTALVSTGPLTVDHVSIGFSGAPSPAGGVAFGAGGSVTNSTITLPFADFEVAIGVSGPVSDTVTLADDTVTGQVPIEEVQQNSSPIVAHRLHLIAGLSALDTPSNVSIDDSLLDCTGQTVANQPCLRVAAVGGTSTIGRARHLTVIGNGNTGFAFGAEAFGGTGVTASLDVSDSVARGFASSVELKTQSTGDIATVTGD